MEKKEFYLKLREIVTMDEHFVACRRKCGYVIGYIKRNDEVRYHMFDDGDSAVIWLSFALKKLNETYKYIEILRTTDVLFD